MKRRVPSEGEMHDEADSVTAGPGIVATKSQARGGLAGVVVGAVVGAVIGAVVGFLFFDGTTGIVIATIAFAVAGLTAGGVAGGAVAPRRRLDAKQVDK